MGILEIVLLIAGVIVIILSFILPASAEKPGEGTRNLAREEIKNMVSEEMNSIKGHVEDVVDEAIGYAVEKTERSLERLTNEKIMAVSEYSDTVMQEIHKNHEEAVFLYDMLNNKHANLKDTVSKADKAAREVAETTREAETMTNSLRKLMPDTALEEAKEIKELLEEEAKPQKAERISTEESSPDREEETARNSNDRILELYQRGKSQVAIAKELGLGVGEVKLVIDLYKNA